jgi:hypothetical protein
MRDWLEGFQENKVWEVVKDLNGEKASLPNGFSMVFFQKCWKVLKGVHFCSF